jgi:hypothetical protein
MPTASELPKYLLGLLERQWAIRPQAFQRREDEVTGLLEEALKEGAEPYARGWDRGREATDLPAPSVRSLRTKPQRRNATDRIEAAQARGEPGRFNKRLDVAKCFRELCRSAEQHPAR